MFIQQTDKSNSWFILEKLKNKKLSGLSNIFQMP